MEISCDFETRSAVDLPKTGAPRYAQDPSTDVWCFSFVDPLSGDILVWTPHDDTHRSRLTQYAEDPEQLFRAWNAQFERWIWQEIMVKRYGFPPILLERWRCTAAEAAALALPRKLDSAAKVLGVVEQKDMAGHRLMMRMSKPRAHIPGGYTWWDDAERVSRLIAYNIQDVKTEMGVKARVRDLTPYELKVYQLDQRINDRGVMLDRELASAVRALAHEVQTRANAELSEVTGGKVRAITGRADILAFLSSENVETDTINKEAVRALLAEENLPEATRRVLELRAEAGKSSVTKVNKMFTCASSVDDRMRGLLLFHGAGTGRWAGRLIQPQNLPARSRALGDSFKAEPWRDVVLDMDYDLIDMSYPVLEVLAMQLRGCLRAAPGKKIIAADFAAIEARVLAWLAGEQWLLDAFANGKDAYRIMASDIYKLPADKIGKPSAERDMGKRVILGCGFQMGWLKFIATCAKEDVLIEEDEAKLIINAYRGKNQAIKALWYELENAAVRAVREPGTIHYAAHGKIAFTKRDDYLRIRLPSGRRTLAYYKPRLVKKMTPWGEEKDTVRFWGENDKKQWVQMDLYGGLLAENITQATARDIMVAAMFLLEERLYSIILTVHDEIVCEVPEDFGSVEEVESLMAQTEAWAEGCPILAEGYSGPRYTK